jgi:hypothetical protein
MRNAEPAKCGTRNAEPAKCGTWNAECGICGFTVRGFFRLTGINELTVNNSAFRIPRSAFSQFRI